MHDQTDAMQQCAVFSSIRLMCCVYIRDSDEVQGMIHRIQSSRTNRISR